MVFKACWTCVTLFPMYHRTANGIYAWFAWLDILILHKHIRDVSLLSLSRPKLNNFSFKIKLLGGNIHNLKELKHWKPITIFNVKYLHFHLKNGYSVRDNMVVYESHIGLLEKKLRRNFDIICRNYEIVMSKLRHRMSKLGTITMSKFRGRWYILRIVILPIASIIIRLFIQ